MRAQQRFEGFLNLAVEMEMPSLAVARVDHQAWNPVARQWGKTIIVRFSTEERRMNPYTRTSYAQQGKGMVVLLRVADFVATLHEIREPTLAQQVNHVLRGLMEKKAS